MKKQEKYELTPYGLLTVILGIESKEAELILDTLELHCRRVEEGEPAIHLNGINSEFIGVKYVKKTKKRK